MPISKYKQFDRTVDLMLDSGAFSAWRKGERLDLREYIKFVQRNSPLLHVCINLDVIPGRPGKIATRDEVQEAAAASLENYQVMRKAGLNPIPVFHQGEEWEWLSRILDSGAGWIGLGGTVGKSNSVRYKFFRECFKRIALHGSPVRVHGFGVTSLDMMFGFPWYSVDSTTWVMASAMGKVLLPCDAGGGKFDFRKLTTVAVTGRRLQDLQAAQWNLGSVYRKYLDSYLRSMGLSLAQLRENQYDRNYVNIRSLMETARLAEVQLYFSTWLREAWNQAPQLTAADARLRLLSYYEVRAHEPLLVAYVKDGSLPTSRKVLNNVVKRYGDMAYRGARITALIAREALREDA